MALHADAVAAEVALAFADAGIESVLLRGGSIARHLYTEDETRVYADADLLIRRAETEKAGAVLRELGFRDVTGLGRRPSDRPPWASTWARDRDGGNVDLHWTLVGVRSRPEDVWSVLAAEVEPLNVPPKRLAALNRTATALIVAMHAAQHGIGVDRVREDLERATSVLPRDTWAAAMHLADRIDALDAYAFGLRLLPGGRNLADDLRLPIRPSVETILRSQDAPPTALGFDWLSQTRGLAGKARLVAGKIVPDRAFIRVWFPPARRGGRVALAAGYVWRPFWLLWHTPTGARSWLAARRAAHEAQRDGR